MDEDSIQIGEIEKRYNNAQNSWNRRVIGYQTKLYHKGLNEHKLLSASEKYLLESKINLQLQKWKERWNREVSFEEANLRTEEAQKALQEIEDLLSHTLSIDDSIPWDKLKDKKEFIEKNPKEYLEGTLSNSTKPVIGSMKPLPLRIDVKTPPKPDKNSVRYSIRLTLIDKLVPAKRRKKELMKEEEYQSDYLRWEEVCKQKYSDYEREYKEVEAYNKKVEDDFNIITASYERLKKHYIDENQKLVLDWEKRRTDFYKKQEEYNFKITKLKNAYLNKDEKAVIEYCERVLSNSEYPDTFPQKFLLEYNNTNKILIIEYELPSIECFPNIKEVKYIAARRELKATYIGEAQLNNMFDDALYKITLRSIHEIFEADKADAIDAISFNGWVKAINKATGKMENNCIISIQVGKSDFLKIDLANVDPKICFKSLKGVAGSKLSALTPIQPILQISRTDKRFVEGYSVVEQIDNSTNLAAMSWEDFEHLIRELFEKEFQSNGGEVKVTQASRDGGVDAIAFDPDPIRGGKIVIQAKRYTNTVGVSAVRDLYGTVVPLYDDAGCSTKFCYNDI